MRISDWSSDVCSSDLRTDQPAHRADQRCLARTVGAEQREYLALANGQINIFQRLGAAGIDFGKPVNFEDWIVHSALRRNGPAQLVLSVALYNEFFLRAAKATNRLKKRNVSHYQLHDQRTESSVRT